MRLSGDDLTGFVSIEINQKEELKNYLGNYIDKLLGIKLIIANSKNNSALLEGLENLHFLQISFLKKLSAYVPNDIELPNSQLKISTPIDGYQLIKIIEELNIEENKISEYIRSRILSANIDQFDDLVTGCLRAEKILVHG